MDAITLTCLTDWFIQTGRRLGYINGNHWAAKALRNPAAARARFVEPSVSNPVEVTAAVRHNRDSVNIGACDPHTMNQK